MIHNVIVNLKEKQHEATSLKVLTHLIHSFKEENEKSTILKEVEQKHGIMSILLTSLVEFKRTY